MKLSRKEMILKGLGALVFMIMPRFVTKVYAGADVPCRTINIKPQLWGDSSWCLPIPGRSGKSYFLNSTAAEIWELIDGRRSRKDIAGIISARYSIPAGESLAAVEELIASLKKQNLLV